MIALIDISMISIYLILSSGDLNVCTICLYMISVLRDMKERGRDLDQILHAYTTYVKPSFEDFCLPVSITKS